MEANMSKVDISLEEIKRMTNGELFMAAVRESARQEGYVEAHAHNVEILVEELMRRSLAAKASGC
jgi:hypothetical protein